jgi:hypothetical protein
LGGGGFLGVSLVLRPKPPQGSFQSCWGAMTPMKWTAFQLDDLHFCFAYQSTALDKGDFLKAIYLELKTDNTEEMKQKIFVFGVKKLMVPNVDTA